MTPATVARVAERALLVRFHDAELALAVAKAQLLHLWIRSVEDVEDTGGKTSLKGRSKGLVGGWEEGGGKDEAGREELSLRERDREDGSGTGEASSRVVLGAGSLLVELAEGEARAGELERFAAKLESRVREIEGTREAGPFSGGREHQVAVSFGGEDGPDLESVARESGLSAERVVERLCDSELSVAFVGFAPGFPYLIGLPRELEVPRLASPRARVPAGSVAIAGPFAGVYPSATPGGWRLLGRLASGEPRLFDPLLDPPARFAAGDRVRFVASPR